MFNISEDTIIEDSVLESYLYENICIIPILNYNNFTIKIWYFPFINEYLSTLVLNSNLTTQYIFDKSDNLNTILQNIGFELSCLNLNEYQFNIEFKNTNLIKTNIINQSYNNIVKTDDIINWFKNL